MYATPKADPPERGNLPMIKKQRDQMTLGEARILGLSAQRYSQLADAYKAAKSGSISYSTGNGSASLALTLLDLQAALALLIEREEAHLASYGVVLDQPPLTPDTVRHAI